MKSIKLSTLIENPNNPRFIEDFAFETLKASIKDFPKMLELRPIVVNDDMVVVGGNMRLKALQALDYKTVPESWVKKASDFTPEELRRFIVLDNSQFGKWENDLLLQQYSVVELESMGVVLPHYEAVDPDDFFEEHEEEERPDLHKIVFQFEQDRFEQVQKGLSAIDADHEKALLKLLNLI